jgi:hypothetical protein
MAIAVAGQRDAHWHPVFDLAMTELRVRDVGGAHTPLIGLQGRIGPTGSHPGPISFYLLAPVYRLLGSSAFALQVSTVVFHATAALTALLVAARRRDARVVVAVGLVLVLLVQGYGLGPLIEPWNPYLPMLWFVTFLVAAWAVLGGDRAMLVVAVVSASICAQTHVPYLAVTLGIGVVLAVVVAHGAWRDGTRLGWRWLAVGALAGLVLWIPPIIDQVVHHPGNMTKLVDNLATPDQDPVGVRAAGRLVLERLDGWQLAVGEARHPGTYVRVLSGPGPVRGRGALSAAAWLVAAGGALAMRHRRLLQLHALVALGTGVALVAISRIVGVAWSYLMLWAFAVGALMLVATVATALVGLARWRPALRGPAHTASVVGGLAVVALVSVRLLAVAPDATTDTPDQTHQLGRIVPGTVAALRAGDVEGGGPDGRYLVSWNDATNGGSEGIGLVNELVRRGFDVGVAARDGVQIGLHRVRPAGEATARVVLASGGWIDRWRGEPGAQEVAFDDPRTPAERSEFAEVRAAAISQLRAMGRSDLVDRIDLDLFDVALNGGLPGSLNLLLGRMLDIGVPVAVFVLPGGGA